MSASALSVLVFGIYLLVIGAEYVFIPNTALGLFKLPKTNEPWIRIMGVVIAVLGFYYIIAAQNELTSFFWATVFGRAGVFVSFILLVIAKKAPPMVILFGTIDLAGGAWTLITLQ